MGESELHIASTLGILLGCSLLVGLLAETLRLPKVTAYLTVGLVLGPSVLDVVPEEHVHTFDPLLKLAMSLVLFGLGCAFPLSLVRRVLWRSLRLSMGELGFTFTFVTLGLLACTQSLSVSLLLGCLALATAPATTVLVLKEFNSEGPVTTSAGILVALNNLVSIVAFELVFLAIHLLDGKLTSPAYLEVLILLRDIAGSVVLGVLVGLLVSYACGFIGSGSWLVMLVAVTTLLLGICESYDVPYMLTFLVMGLTVANSSDVTNRIVAQLDRITGLLCVLFFAVHGSELDLGAFWSAGLVGGVYIVCRIAGKWLGIYTAATLFGEAEAVRRWLGLAILAQAGAAIALSSIAAHRDPALGLPVQTIILGSVVVFEIVGPIWIREAVLRSGEVPLAQAIHHTSNTPLSQLRKVWRSLRAAVRRESPAPSPPAKEKTVADLLRRNVQGIHESAGFDAVVAHIEHSHDNTYPVVNDELALVGLIRYALVSNALFDPMVGSLVRAEDLATPAIHVLHPEDPISRAVELFRLEADDCLPVVSPEAPHPLLGIVRRSDVMDVLIMRHRKARSS